MSEKMTAQGPETGCTTLKQATPKRNDDEKRKTHGLPYAQKIPSLHIAQRSLSNTRPAIRDKNFAKTQRERRILLSNTYAVHE